MSSLALYRRYRPETFAEVIGQSHVTDPLQQALRNNRVNHAYLFSGPRGCGKTTSARILARCLNCEQGPTPTPCGQCQSCQDLARGGRGSIDVIEIDAASHGGVDDARDLREKAFFGPASSRYKIYIIDEAHMVTSAGFNALLKVVEEPPEHLKFIFATTEPEKVIGTIRSRTHHYPFRLVPPGTLRDYLAEVCEHEKIAVEDGVLPLVVRAGAGSVRDSMSVMDQLLAGAADEGVTYAMATALLGYTDGSLLDSVVDAFAAGDGAAAFEVVDRVIEGGNDPRRFVADLLERLRDLVILAAVPDAEEKGLIDAPADLLERMRAQASVFGAAELSRAADLVNEGLTEMRGATSPRLQLELICARVLLPAAYSDERSLQARLDRLERGAAGGPQVSMAAPGDPVVEYVPGPGGHQAAPPAGPGGPAAARAAMREAGGAPQQYPPQAQQPQPQQSPPGPSAPSPSRPSGPGPVAGGEEAAEASGRPGPARTASPGAWPTSGSAAGGPDAGPSGAPAAPRDEPSAPRGETPGGGNGTAAARQPGAWPAAAGPGRSGASSGVPGAPAGESGGADARRPGSWPTAAAPGRTRPRPEPEQDDQAAAGHSQAPAADPGRQHPGSPGGGPASGAGPQAAGGAAQGDMAQGAVQVRQMWPGILEAVKNRRRFTWILLSQNAQVAGFDGRTLQIGFSNSGARDSFVGSGSEDVLKQALSEGFGVQWQIEALVDPSGGAGAGGAPPARGPGGNGGYGGGGQGPAAPAPSGYSPPAPRSQDGGSGPAAGEDSGGSRAARAAVSGSASAGQGQPAGGPQSSSPAGSGWSEQSSPYEEDMPAEDDPDLVDSALSGHDLIVRELGATVLEEFSHE
ncbi:DNA polymerase III subunit gamma and tau [Streptomyces sp. NPDC059740]|uniref:DNA polymerase III subunit gamma and tau n=1 Tax=Streptomyces sp. NPDC059740 TaxID=3346926 RepID=UPI003662EE34